MPSEISSSCEKAGDWTCCLSMLFLFDILRLRRHPKSNIDIHEMMIKVIKKSIFPPHRWLQRCIDLWILKCLNKPTSNQISIGYPILPNEVKTLTSPLLVYDLGNLQHAVCDTCRIKPSIQKNSNITNSNHDVNSSINNSDTILSDLFWSYQDEDNEKNKKIRSKVHCACLKIKTNEIYQSSSNSSSNNTNTTELFDSAWQGVISCYASLQFGVLSIDIKNSFNGIFVSNYRELPIKKAIQFLVYVGGNNIGIYQYINLSINLYLILYLIFL
jgi:hypothetical protein